LKPEQARTVLPQSTKAELVMTGTLGHWDHFFDMRARQTTGPAHPQAAEVAIPLMHEMAARFPDVIRA
jgi:thymidylate synthase (FAD)